MFRMWWGLLKLRNTEYRDLHVMRLYLCCVLYGHRLFEPSCVAQNIPPYPIDVTINTASDK